MAAAAQVMPGDWTCPNCGDHVFARNSQCRRCATPRPDMMMMGMAPNMMMMGCGGCAGAAVAAGGQGCRGGQQAMPGDWSCPNCGDLVFARNAACRRCGTPRSAAGGMMMPMANMGGMMMPMMAAQPCMMGMAGCGGAAAGQTGQTMKPGDWNCPSCGDLQFARNAACRRCGAPRPVALGGGFAGGGGGGGCGAVAAEVDGSVAVGGCMASSGSGNSGGGSQAPRPGDWYCPSCGDLQFARNAGCRKCGTPRPLSVGAGEAAGAGAGAVAAAPAVDPEKLKPGDWICPNCGDHVFARNANCRRCMTPKPVEDGAVAGVADGVDGAAAVAGAADNARPGDWHCPACFDLQFARNVQCRRCGTPRPGSMMAEPMTAATFYQYGGGGAVSPGMAMGGMAAGMAAGGMGGTGGMRPGDWLCGTCNDIQFARNAACRRCGTPKPANLPCVAASGAPRNSMPGDWSCPACGDHQFARNSVCRKCGAPRPGGEAGGSRERSPRRGGGR